MVMSAKSSPAFVQDLAELKRWGAAGRGLSYGQGEPYSNCVIKQTHDKFDVKTA